MARIESSHKWQNLPRHLGTAVHSLQNRAAAMPRIMCVECLLRSATSAILLNCGPAKGTESPWERIKARQTWARGSFLPRSHIRKRVAHQLHSHLAILSSPAACSRHMRESSRLFRFLSWNNEARSIREMPPLLQFTDTQTPLFQQTRQSAHRASLLSTVAAYCIWET